MSTRRDQSFFAFRHAVALLLGAETNGKKQRCGPIPSRRSQLILGPAPAWRALLGGSLHAAAAARAAPHVPSQQIMLRRGLAWVAGDRADLIVLGVRAASTPPPRAHDYAATSTRSAMRGRRRAKTSSHSTHEQHHSHDFVEQVNADSSAAARSRVAALAPGDRAAPEHAGAVTNCAGAMNEIATR